MADLIQTQVIKLGLRSKEFKKVFEKVVEDECREKENECFRR